MSVNSSEMSAGPVVKVGFGETLRSVWGWLSKVKQKEARATQDQRDLHQALDSLIDGPMVGDDLKDEVRGALQNGNKEVTQALAARLDFDLFKKLGDKTLDPGLRKQLSNQKAMAVNLKNEMEKQIRAEGKQSRASVDHSDGAWRMLLTPQ